MSLEKQLKQAEKIALRQQKILEELESLVKSIERSEKTIQDLKVELEEVNQKYGNRKTTQEDIHYLTELLKCANKKLAWEKQMASLQKKTPAILEEMTSLLNNPDNPPSEQFRQATLSSLQAVQDAMQRLDTAKVQ